MGLLHNTLAQITLDHPQVNMHWIDCMENIFTVQDSCACPKKQSVLWIHCIAYIFFIIQDFWATCGCPEKQSGHELIHCIEYILLSTRSFEQLALALKIFTVLKHFLSFRNFEQLSLALKFFKPWGAAAPPPASCVNARCCLKLMGLAFKYVVEINSTS